MKKRRGVGYREWLEEQVNLNSLEQGEFIGHGSLDFNSDRKGCIYEESTMQVCGNDEVFRLHRVRKLHSII